MNIKFAALAGLSTLFTMHLFAGGCNQNSDYGLRPSKRRRVEQSNELFNVTDNDVFLETGLYHLAANTCIHALNKDITIYVGGNVTLHNPQPVHVPSFLNLIANPGRKIRFINVSPDRTTTPQLTVSGRTKWNLPPKNQIDLQGIDLFGTDLVDVSFARSQTEKLWQPPNAHDLLGSSDGEN